MTNLSFGAGDFSSFLLDEAAARFCVAAAGIANTPAVFVVPESRAAMILVALE